MTSKQAQNTAATAGTGNRDERSAGQVDDTKDVDAAEQERRERADARKREQDGREMPSMEGVKRVSVKGRGDVVESQRIGEVTVSTDHNGQVCRVDFGGLDIEAQ